MKEYKVLNNQSFTDGSYSIVPLRFEDRMLIMQWRNEQLYHLRQQKPLTAEDQDNYFNTVVARLFDQEQPGQILFSYLENGICVGYGGLVHINWADRNSEISFIMNTSLEKDYYAKHLLLFLKLIEEVAFMELRLHKIFTYAFDIRPHLYPVLETAGFDRDAVLKEHCLFNGEFKDVVIHSKINRTK
jgi:RimJ/RimL family protein N-acetyltransferase